MTEFCAPGHPTSKRIDLSHVQGCVHVLAALDARRLRGAGAGRFARIGATPAGRSRIGRSAVERADGRKRLGRPAGAGIDAHARDPGHHRSVARGDLRGDQRRTGRVGGGKTGGGTRVQTGHASATNRQRNVLHRGRAPCALQHMPRPDRHSACAPRASASRRPGARRGGRRRSRAAARGGPRVQAAVGGAVHAADRRVEDRAARQGLRKAQAAPDDRGSWPARPPPVSGAGAGGCLSMGERFGLSASHSAPEGRGEGGARDCRDGAAAGRPAAPHRRCSA